MNERYRVRIDVQIYDAQGGGSLRVSEDAEVEAADFLAMAGILGQFHDVLTKIKEAS
jgi:hypothetical protein